MKKRFLAMFAVVTFFILSAVPASAVVNDTIKVGLRYGSSAMTSANLENDVGEGYELSLIHISPENPEPLPRGFLYLVRQ